MSKLFSLSEFFHSTLVDNRYMLVAPMQSINMSKLPIGYFHTSTLLEGVP